MIDTFRHESSPEQLYDIASNVVLLLMVMAALAMGLRLVVHAVGQREAACMDIDNGTRPLYQYLE